MKKKNLLIALFLTVSCLTFGFGKKDTINENTVKENSINKYSVNFIVETGDRTFSWTSTVSEGEYVRDISHKIINEDNVHGWYYFGEDGKTKILFDFYEPITQDYTLYSFYRSKSIIEIFNQV